MNELCYGSFLIVLGSSGSGKSYFAVKDLPQLVFPDVCRNEVLVVHFQADRAVNLMNEANGVDFSLAAASYVKKLIECELAYESFEDVKSLQLNVHVVIDEAGGYDLKEFFDEAGKINAIVNAIKNRMSIKILNDVHVAIVGTGLESTTMNIKAGIESIKFRMQPWTLYHFDAYVDASTHPDKAAAKQIVRDFPSLIAFVSNGRCASFLVNIMTRAWNLHDTIIESFVDLVLAKSIQLYISSNALFNLSERPSDKWAVVRAVFGALDEALQHPGVAFLPQWKSVECQRVRSVATCLVDTHVEGSGDSATLTEGERFSISMSPAIAMVLVMYINEDSISMFRNWDSFEFVAMLGEWKWMMANLRDIPRYSTKSIQLLETTILPEEHYDGGDNAVFALPVTNQFTVLLNVPDSKYADVIAPYRLVKAKFAMGSSQSVTLNLKDELDNLGLTNAPNRKVQQTVTSIFYSMWETTNGDPTTSTEATTGQEVVDDQYRFGYYPYDTLGPRRWIEKSGEVICQVSNKSVKSYCLGHGKKRVCAREVFVVWIGRLLHSSSPAAKLLRWSSPQETQPLSLIATMLIGRVR